MGTTGWFRNVIVRKRDGGAVAEDEWRRFVAELTTGQLADYQVAAFLMAIYFRGMTVAETAALTDALAASGEQLSFPRSGYVDKHSTGGVGDATTLVAVPWAAACGAHIPKLSGRALGYTGGTTDKLGAVGGFTLSLPADRFQEQVARIGCAIADAGALAPADKLLYELRDVTGTVPARPLIVASILSKKFAAGAPAFVFDVKCGAGAFMKTEADARKLAAELVEGARAGGRQAVAVISAMDQPLGRAVGNALEVAAAAAVLRGEGPADLLELSGVLAAEMLVLAGVAVRAEVGERLDRALSTGAAAAKLDEMMRAQGAARDWVARLPRAAKTRDVVAAESGYLSRLDALAVARAAAALGAGRARKNDVVDYAAGIVLQKKVGDAVERGQPVLTLHYNDGARVTTAYEEAAAAITVGRRPKARPLIIDIVR